MILRLDSTGSGAGVARVDGRAPKPDAAAKSSAGEEGRVATANALVAVNAHQRGGNREVPGSEPGPGSRGGDEYATGAVRDQFLAALDEADPARALGIARHLISCGNPLPTATCSMLGLPAGSSYGAGARAVMAKAGAGR
jgi:hypothetical protein